MATLVSPGVSVSVTNESFFFPASAPTVPLFFIATRSGKLQANGVTPAAGTLEANVVRTVTLSLSLLNCMVFHTSTTTLQAMSSTATLATNMACSLSTTSLALAHWLTLYAPTLT